MRLLYVILRKPSKRKEINGFYHRLGYHLVSNDEEYDTYVATSNSESSWVTSGYSGTISSSGSVSLSPDTSSVTTTWYEVEKDKEKKKVSLYRWMKIVPHGKKTDYMQREANFLTLARPYFQLESGCSTMSVDGDPNALAMFLYTLFLTLSFAWTSISSVFWLMLSPFLLPRRKRFPLLRTFCCIFIARICDIHLFHSAISR